MKGLYQKIGKLSAVLSTVTAYAPLPPSSTCVCTCIATHFKLWIYNILPETIISQHKCCKSSLVSAVSLPSQTTPIKLLFKHLYVITGILSWPPNNNIILGQVFMWVDFSNFFSIVGEEKAKNRVCDILQATKLFWVGRTITFTCTGAWTICDYYLLVYHY